MRRTVVGIVAVAAAAGVFTMGGIGVAAAAMSPHTASASQTAAQTEAASLKALHDSLAAEWNKNDVAAMRVTQAKLAGELALLANGTGRHAMVSGFGTAIAKAQAQNNKLGTALAATTRHGLAEQLIPVIPVLPGSVSGVVQSLLNTLLGVVSGLTLGFPGIPVIPIPIQLPTTSAAVPASAG